MVQARHLVIVVGVGVEVGVVTACHSDSVNEGNSDQRASKVHCFSNVALVEHATILCQ